MWSFFNFSIETPEKQHVVGLEFPDEEFKPEYENLDNPETKKLTDKIEQAVSLDVAGFGFVFVFMIICYSSVWHQLGPPHLFITWKGSTYNKLSDYSRPVYQQRAA